MIIINSLNESRFTLNNVQYFKNYTTRVAGDKLTIYNAYDNKDVLVPLTPFDQFRVNGGVYETIEELQIAIIGVCYTRTTLEEGSPNSQNNIGKYLSFGEIDGGNDYITPADVAAFINNLNYSIVVTAIDAPVTFDFTRNGVRYLFDFTPGKGIWGSANGANFGGTVQSFHFKLKSVFNITPTDIEDNQGATIISLGDVPTGDYLTKANSVQRDFNGAGELDENGNLISYYLSYTTDNVLYFVQFVGEGGSYNGTLTANDFVSTTNSNVVADINYENVLQTGNFASIGAIHKDADTGMITEFHGGGFGSTLGDYTQKFLVDTPVGNYTITFPAATQNDNVVYESTLHEGLNSLSLQAVIDNGSTATVNTEISITSEQTETDPYPGASYISLEGGIIGVSAKSIGISSTENLGIGSGSNSLSFNSDSFQLLGGAGGIIQSNNTTGITINGNSGGVNIGGHALGVNISGDGGGINLLGGTNGITLDGESGGININGGNGNIDINTSEGAINITSDSENITIAGGGSEGKTIIGAGGLDVTSVFKAGGQAWLPPTHSSSNYPNSLNSNYFDISTNTNNDFYIYSQNDITLQTGTEGNIHLNGAISFGYPTIFYSTADFSNTPTTNIGAPTLDTHLTNKKYVDDVAIQDLQNVTDTGATTTNAISTGGLTIPNNTLNITDGSIYNFISGNGTPRDFIYTLRISSPGFPNVSEGSSEQVDENTQIRNAFYQLQNQINENADNAITLSGTEEGNPVTGDIEFEDGQFLQLKQGNRYIAFTDDDRIEIDIDGSGFDFGGGSATIRNATGSIDIAAGMDSKGLSGGHDYTSNITALDYVQKKYVDDVAIQDLQNVTDTGATTTNAITTGGLTIPVNTLNITGGSSFDYINGLGDNINFTVSTRTTTLGTDTTGGDTSQLSTNSQLTVAIWRLQNQINENTVNTIPLSGTEVGSPVTGDIEFDASSGLGLNAGIGGQITFDDVDGIFMNGGNGGISLSGGNLGIVLNGLEEGITLNGGNGGVNIDGGVLGTNLYNLYYITAVSDTNDIIIEATNGGMKYSSDYSLNYTNRSLVDKEYVDEHAPRILHNNVTDSATLTGTTDDTILKSFLIPAGTISDGILSFAGVFEKTGTADQVSYRVSINTTNSISGSTRIATLVPGSANHLYSYFGRELIVNGSSVYGYPKYSSSNDGEQDASSSSSATLDTGADFYIIVSAALNDATDSVTQKSFKINFEKATE